MKNKIFKTISINLCILSLNLAFLYGQSAEDIIKKMEEKMFPSSRAEMTLRFVTKTTQEDYVFTSFARDNNQKIIVRFKSPAAMLGSDLLMLDRNVWLYDPKSGREMKIPSNQSFGGTGFSYGDILRLNYSDNYTASIKEDLGDSWIVDLVAKQKDAPYHAISLEIAKDFTPILGRCFTRSGDLIKEMEYSNSKLINGVLKPLTVRVTSPLDPSEVSTLTLVKEEKKEYPLSIFNKRNLSLKMEENY